MQLTPEELADVHYVPTLSELRHQSRLTSRELAELVGLTRARISQMEANGRITTSVIERLAKALNVSEYLVFLSAKKVRAGK